MPYLHSVVKDFAIRPTGSVSRLSLKLGLTTFREACEHLLHLPYRRPFGKTPTAVLDEGCGTCSSKHAVLKRLAKEQGEQDIELMLVIFKMTARNAHAAKEVFRQGPLKIIPEAHNYIRWGDEKIDVTKPGFHISNLQSVLLEERVSSLEELSHKSNLHRTWLGEWLSVNHPNVSLEEAWQQREDCISALGST